MRFFFALLALLSIPHTARAEQPIVHLSMENQTPSTTQLSVQPGAGSRRIPGIFGHALEPAPGNSALQAELPHSFWSPKGTLEFWFRSAHCLRGSSPSKPVQLLGSPIFDLTLTRKKNALILKILLHTQSERPPRAEILLSRLHAKKWYHLAIIWNAPRGRLDCYLNGTLQQEARLADAGKPWIPARTKQGSLRLGGTLESRTEKTPIAVDEFKLHATCLNPEVLASSVTSATPLEGEGRTEHEGGLDLRKLQLESVYNADFQQPLEVIHENRLFDGNRRLPLPEKAEWILEGPGRAWCEEGSLHLRSDRPEDKGHVVLWNRHDFPANFLLEFGLSPQNSQRGLNILFFSTTARNGIGSPFHPTLPRRDGVFKAYHSGELDGYHLSYWASAAPGNGIPRRTANLRKNRGFHLIGCGDDRITGMGPGPHRIRVLKVGGQIQIEVNGKLALTHHDKGQTHGPTLGAGAIGLRQMSHTVQARYTHFQVWRVSQR